MDDGPRFFSVEEANDLIGALQLEFGRVAQVRSELQPLIESMGGRPTPPCCSGWPARSPPPSSASTRWAAW
jgi:hypothetical protein